MRFDGRPSWEFGHGSMGYLETALFVRDSARLPVEPGASVPPRLRGDVPDCSGVLASGDGATAAQQWAAWWYRLIRQTATEWQRRSATPPSAADPRQDRWAVIREQAAGREEVFDPPEFASLARLQSLRAVVISTLASASASSRGPAARQAEGSSVFAWPVVRDVAENTASELGVPVGAIAGYAYVLPLEGQWSYLAGLRAVLGRAGP